MEMKGPRKCVCSMRDEHNKYLLAADLMSIGYQASFPGNIYGYLTFLWVYMYNALWVLPLYNWCRGSELKPRTKHTAEVTHFLCTYECYGADNLCGDQEDAYVP
jgi:hypothetical protein